MMLLAALLEVAGIGMIPAFVSIVADPDQVMQFAPIERLLATLGITTSRELLIWGGVTLVLVFMVKNLYLAAYFYVEERYTYSRFYYIAHRLMSSYMQAPYTFHLQRNSAELIQNTTQEVSMIKSTIYMNEAR